MISGHSLFGPHNFNARNVTLILSFRRPPSPWTCFWSEYKMWGRSRVQRWKQRGANFNPLITAEVFLLLIQIQIYAFKKE